MAVPRVVVPAAVAVLALTSACVGGSGSGGSSAGIAAKTVPAGKWVDTVCGSLGRYDKATKQPFLAFL